MVSAFSKAMANPELGEVNLSEIYTIAFVSLVGNVAWLKNYKPKEVLEPA